MKECSKRVIFYILSVILFVVAFFALLIGSLYSVFSPELIGRKNGLYVFAFIIGFLSVYGFFYSIYKLIKTKCFKSLIFIALLTICFIIVISVKLNQ